MKNYSSRFTPSLMLAFLALLPCASGDTVEFFEKLYETRIEGVKPMEEYQDPDQYYTAIARKLNIPKAAFEEVSKKFGWGRDKNKIQQAIIKRGHKSDHWEVMIFQFGMNLETKKPDVKTMEHKMVFVYDDGRISFPEMQEGAKKSEKIGEDETRTPPHRETAKGEKGHEHRHEADTGP